MAKDAIGFGARKFAFSVETAGANAYTVVARGDTASRAREFVVGFVSRIDPGKRVVLKCELRGSEV